MLVTIKPHSSLSKFFTDKECTIDVKSYIDIVYYLHSMQPAFIQYLRKQKLNNCEESYVFLDKNLKIMNIDELVMRKAKENDVVYIVPAIIGGGGKRGGLFAILAIAAFVFLPILGAGAGAAGGAGAGAAAATTAATTGAGLLGKLGASGFFKNLLANLALSVLSSLFSSKPKEEQTRQNDMFGSLTNSTASGVPIALNYGMVRVAGQMISGYINTTEHGRSVKIDVFGELVSDKDVNFNTPEDQQVKKRDNLLKGFNQYA